MTNRLYNLTSKHFEELQSSLRATFLPNYNNRFGSVELIFFLEDRITIKLYRKDKDREKELFAGVIRSDGRFIPNKDISLTYEEQALISTVLYKYINTPVNSTGSAPMEDKTVEHHHHHKGSGCFMTGFAIVGVITVIIFLLGAVQCSAPLAILLGVAASM